MPESLSAHGGIARSPFAPSVFPTLPRVAGVETRACACGARYSMALPGREDLLLVSCAAGSVCAGVFTPSTAAAAPVLWSRRALRKTTQTRAILINAGEANALTGTAGDEVVVRSRDGLARLMGIEGEQVLLASTGVIGEPPDSAKIEAALPRLLASAACDWQRAARAFSTTDSFPKGASETLEIDGVPIVIAGIAKGAGMIAPNMATMLGLVATDAALPAPLLRELLRAATASTFNAVSVDGDMSTNDTVFAIASGAREHKPLVALDDGHAEAFVAAFVRVLRSLARQIAMDGEGIGKFITLWTRGARSEREGREVGLAVLSSPLVKVALAYGDANWGRIAMAIGKTGIPVRWDKASIAFGERAEHVVFDRGEPVEPTSASTEALTREIRGGCITITLDLAVGVSPAVETWGCDLTHEYLRINGDYRS